MSLIKVFVAFEELVIFGTIHNQQSLKLLFFCFVKTSFFLTKGRVNFTTSSTTRPLSLLCKFFISYTTLCNSTAYCVSKDDITQFRVLLTIKSFHFAKAGLSETCIFLYTLGSLGSKMSKMAQIQKTHKVLRP